MNPKNINKLIKESLIIETETAKETGAIGYTARVLTQATIPHRKVLGNEFTRKNGIFSLSILSPTHIGLPYGTIPRLLVSWLTTEAVRTKIPEIVLGNTLSGFMQELGLIPSGGRWGTIARLKDQMQRLFSSSIICHYDNENELNGAIGINIAKEYQLWWQLKHPEQATLWHSTVTLSKDFFDEIINRPIPIDLRAIKALKRSPLALDIYCWLTYRMSYLKKNSVISWEILQLQFGSDYAQTEQGKRDFKRAFLRELKKVTNVYDGAKLEVDSQAVILKPGKPHIPFLKK